MFTLYSDHVEISPKIMHNNTTQQSRPHRLQCKNHTANVLIFKKEMLLCMTFWSASARPTATSTQSKWSITNQLMSQKSLCPSQTYTNNLRKKGNYDLCLIWVSLNNNLVCSEYSNYNQYYQPVKHYIYIVIKLPS